jgi:ankyrin repeat protein
MAAQQGLDDVVTVLLKAEGVRVNARMPTTGVTPLYVAAEQGHAEVVR